MGFDILAIGELNVDSVVRVGDSGPEFGQKEKTVSEAVGTLDAQCGRNERTADARRSYER
jgi:hypothetical protein